MDALMRIHLLLSCNPYNTVVSIYTLLTDILAYKMPSRKFCAQNSIYGTNYLAISN